jgi:Flp pilus assembly pilin Flp
MGGLVRRIIQFADVTEIEPGDDGPMIQATNSKLISLAAAWWTARAGERGATMVEYAIILGLLSVAAVAVMSFLGADVLNLFQGADDAFDPPAP